MRHRIQHKKRLKEAKPTKKIKKIQVLVLAGYDTYATTPRRDGPFPPLPRPSHEPRATVQMEPRGGPSVPHAELYYQSTPPHRPSNLQACIQDDRIFPHLFSLHKTFPPDLCQYRPATTGTDCTVLYVIQAAWLALVGGSTFYGLPDGEITERRKVGCQILINIVQS